MYLLRQIFNLFLFYGVLFCGGPRIISLAPSITDFLIRFKLEKYIVGKTYLDPDYINAEIVLGSSMRISHEKIINLKPTHIITAGLVPEEDFEFIRNKKIKIISLKYETLLDIAETFLILGKEFNLQEKSLFLLKSFLDSLYLFKNKKNGKKVLYILDMTGGIWTCGKNTFISDLLRWVGFKNIGDVFKDYKIISPELILKEKPDIVIFAFKSPENYFKGTFLEKLSAIKKNKFYSVPNSDYFSRPSPKILKALKFLSEIN